MSAGPPIAASGERKLAVIVFVDLTGYTELVRRLDPEAVVSTVQPVMSMMRRAVENEGGVVPSVAGDGFMAVFGVPTAAPDLGAAALRSANAIRRVVGAVNAAPGAVRVPDVHVGVAAGEVYVVPSEEPTGWSLVGNAVNLASRLCDAAAAGELLVDEQFRRLAGPALGPASPRELAVKGVGGRLGVWAVDSGPAVAEPEARVVPFVGRADVLRQLDAAWEEVTALAVSKVVLVSATSGLGKTRLARQWLETRGLAHRWFWCGHHGEESTLVAVARQLGNGGPDRLRDAVVDRADPTRPDPYPAVAAAARELLTAAAREPTLLVLDDADRADASLIDFVADLRRDPLAAPLLVVATWRSDEAVPPWTADMELGPLADADSRALLANALGADPPATVAAAVTSRAAGHPLMLVQSAAYLLEAGVVTVRDGACEVGPGVDLQALPTSLRLFVAARLDRLPAAEKAALQELSTSGESVPDNVARRVFRPAVIGAATTLQQRGLLRPGSDGWEFTHGIVQQVAYGALPRSVRAELHRRHWEAHPATATGERFFHALRWADCAMATQSGERLDAVAAALAAALAHGGVLFASQAAAALEVIERVGRLLEDFGLHFPTISAELRSLEASCLVEMGRFDEALHAADSALGAAEESADSGVRLSALLVRGHALARLRDYATARQTLEQAHALAVQTGAPAAAGQALRLLGYTWRHQSFPEFVALVEQAHEASRDAGDTGAALEDAALLAYLTSFSSPRRFRRWRAVAAAATDPRARLWAGRAEAEANRIRWRHAEALVAAESAAALAGTLGATDGIADGLSVTIHAATALGRLGDALEAFDRLRRLAVRTDNPRMRLMAAAAGALPLLRAGRVADSEHELRHALDTVDAFGEGEAGEAFTAATLVARDRGLWPDAARRISEVMKSGLAADFVLDVLHARVLDVGLQADVATEADLPSLRRLADECTDADAGPMAAYVHAIAERVTVLAGGEPTLDEAAVTLDEAGLRADTVALFAERRGNDPRPLWAAAAETWERLGTTVFLARAQARSGDTAGATATLDLLRADETARGWALAG